MSLLGRLSFVAHLVGCSACRAYLRQMRTTVVLLRQLGREHEGEPVPPELMAMFRAWQPGTDVARPGRAARALAALDRLLGGARARLGVVVLLLGSAGLLGLARPIAGPALPLSDGLACLAQEIIAGLVPLLAVTALVCIGRRPVSGGVHAFVAGAGALAGQATLHFACPVEGWRVHMAAFHTGGVLLAVLIGFAASRLTPFAGRG